MNHPVNDDFENKLATLLAERVDRQLGGQRPAPPFEAPRVIRDVTTGPSHRAPWLMPVIAAACVAAIALGGVGVSRLVGDNDGNAPAGPVGPSKISSGPRPTTTPKPATKPTPEPTALPAKPVLAPPTGAPNVVNLDGAHIALPSGWDVRPQGPQGSPGTSAWCIHQPSGPAGDCITLYEFGANDEETRFDADLPGLGVGNTPQLFCDNETLSSVSEEVARVSFGGRQAEYRRIDHYCSLNTTTAKHKYVVQYATNSHPAWALVAAPATVRMLGVMDYVATRSILPERSRPLPLAQRGDVTSIATTSAGVKVEIDPAVRTVSGRLIVGAPRNYRVPTAMFGKSRVQIGSPVVIRTDGTTVRSLALDRD